MRIETIETRKWTFTVNELKAKLGIDGPGDMRITVLTEGGGDTGMFFDLDLGTHELVQVQLITVSEGAEVETP